MKNILILLALLLFTVAAYYAYDNLRERTYAEKVGDIVHLEDQRDFNAKLKSYLEDPNSELRARAALAIGRIGAEGSGQILTNLISADSSMDVAAVAAFAIGLTGQKQFAAELLDLAVDLPSKVALPLVEAAGRLTDTSMAEETKMLAGFLSHPSPDVREVTCMALFRAGARDLAPQLIEFAKSEPDEEVQVAALYALSRLGIAEATEIYTRHIADADPYVRSLAVRGFGSSDSKEATHYLNIALNDSDPRVVAQAVASLSGKDSNEAKSKLAKKLSMERDEKLRVAMINGLARQNNDMGLDAVNAIVASGPSPNIIAAAVKYLATVQKDRAVSLIDSVQTVDDPNIRAACADAYAAIGTKNIIPRLAVLFNDNNPLVRMTAFNHLVDLDSANLDFYIGKALEDTSYVLPVVAIDQIKTRGLSSYLPKLNSIMALGLAVNEEIRLSLVDCVEPFIGKAEVDTNAREILNYGILDPDYIVRRTAAEIYKEKLDKDYSGRVKRAKTQLSKGKVIGGIQKYRSNPYATIVTERGEIEMELYFDVAPLTVLNFIELARDGYFEGIIFHRVIPNFVVQGGDPEGFGWGGPGYTIRCEYSEEPYRRGTVGMATSGKDTGGSQFFITHTPLPHLDGRYTVFGQVLVGMDVVDQIVRGDVIKEVTIHESKYE